MSEETNEFLDRSDLDFVRDVLIDALDQRRDSLVSELFDLYNRVRQRENATPDPLTGLGNINIDTISSPDGGTQYNFSIGGEDNISIGNSADVISFS